MRKCENWLKTYLSWTLTRTESPESYLLFSGLFCISAALRRNVYIPKHYLGGWTCYPHIYAVLVGPAGEVRKTTAMNQAIELLVELSGLTKGPNIVTQAALLDRIVKADDNAVYLTAKELSDLIMKSGPEMYEFLTSMFDGDKHFEAATMGRGIEFAEAPCVNMLAATTPEWLAGSMPEAAIGGGFASRCMFLYEDTPRFKKLFYNEVVHEKSLESISADLIADLAHMMSLKGEFKFTADAIAFGEEWYQQLKIPRGTKLAGYIARKPTHMFKLAMLLSVAQNDDLIIDKIHLTDALAILDSVESRLTQVFEGVGRNTYAMSSKAIVTYIKREGKVTQANLMRTFNSTAEPRKFEELLNGLIKAKYIKATETDAGEIIFMPDRD